MSPDIELKTKEEKQDYCFHGGNIDNNGQQTKMTRFLSVLVDKEETSVWVLCG